MSKKLTKVICGFPGIGKSTFMNNHKNLTIRDSDSSQFPKEPKGVFPGNYVEATKKLYDEGQHDVILVSTHEEAVKALHEVINPKDIFIFVPHISLKEEYIKRYHERNSPQFLIDIISNNWDKWLTFIEETYPKEQVHVLQSGEYLSEMFDRIFHAPNDSRSREFPHHKQGENENVE